MGTPKRCMLPMAQSAPSSPGDLSKTKAMGSQATIEKAPCFFAAAIAGAKSATSPSAPTYWNSAPKQSTRSTSAASPTTTSKPWKLARVRTTSMVWG